MKPLQVAYLLAVVGGFLVVAVIDPKAALSAVFGLAAIFGACAALEKIFGGR